MIIIIIDRDVTIHRHQKTMIMMVSILFDEIKKKDDMILIRKTAMMETSKVIKGVGAGAAMTLVQIQIQMQLKI